MIVKQRFIEIIKAVVGLPGEQEEEILKISVIKSLKKGEHFINAGNVPVKLAFNLE